MLLIEVPYAVCFHSFSCSFSRCVALAVTNEKCELIVCADSMIYRGILSGRSLGCALYCNKPDGWNADVTCDVLYLGRSGGLKANAISGVLLTLLGVGTGPMLAYGVCVIPG